MSQMRTPSSSQRRETQVIPSQLCCTGCQLTRQSPSLGPLIGVLLCSVEGAPVSSTQQHICLCAAVSLCLCRLMV